jgi:hypothetical protein
MESVHVERTCWRWDIKIKMEHNISIFGEEEELGPNFFTMLKMKIQVLRDVISIALIDSYLCCKVEELLHIQGPAFSGE